MESRAIVVGATSGIGREVALLLAENGYRVGVIGRREENLKELTSLYQGQIVGQAADVTDVDAARSAIESLISELGGLELIIISSGYGEINKELDFEIEHNSINVNVVGFTFIADYAYRYFSSQDKGHIVGITSVMGLRGSCAAPAYSATKAYQINYLESLHQRARTQGKDVIITDIRPGSVNTAMMKGEGHFWISSPQRAALQIYRAIKRKKSVAYVTRRWSLIGILLRILPRCIFVRMGKI